MELLRSRLNQQKNDFMKGKFYIFLMHAHRNHLMLMLTLRPSQDSVIPVLISGGAVEHLALHSDLWLRNNSPHLTLAQPTSHTRDSVISGEIFISTYYKIIQIIKAWHILRLR